MRKYVKKFYFSVEGETEKWYLTHLQKLINSTGNSKFKVSFNCSVESNPVKRVKSLVITDKTEICHFFDFEGNEKKYTDRFRLTLSKLKEASEIGKNISYRCGYSNLTFELWIILHKCESNSPYSHRKQYLNEINKAYDENFESLREYKNEKNFNRIMSKINMNDVKRAINYAKNIMKRNSENGFKTHRYKGYYYFKENPSLSVWEVIEKILQECQLTEPT